MCEFLYEKFSEGASSSSVNSYNSAINFFTLNSLGLENDPFVKRLFKYFYKVKPIKPKHLTFWPVSKLLNFLETWHPIEDLSLKQLTLKTIAMIALSSSDRGQTIHLASVGNMNIESDKIEFIIKKKIKTTRRILKPTIITCVVTNNEKLNVSNYVLKYIERTKNFREQDGKLFLSWATKKPVSRQTLSRWLVHVLYLSGIDTSSFQAHSYRGAGLSHAFQKGATINQVVQAGSWSNEATFRTFYNAPSSDSAIGKIILENS